MDADAKTKAGVVLYCHGEMGRGMLHAAEMILGPQSQVEAIGVAPGDGPTALAAKLGEAIERTDGGVGVLVLTDMAGGTPCNLVAARPPTKNVEMVTGFNLPALLRALRERTEHTDLARLAADTAAYGGRHIATLRALLVGED
ncbi:MAG: PTS sugar transporter subunit IIA [Deltaproteobacteria bacterium]|nr:PTS sugar transporter subunit IIA [Deltaproteobacteria bacterium]